MNELLTHNIDLVNKQDFDNQQITWKEREGEIWKKKNNNNNFQWENFDWSKVKVLIFKIGKYFDDWRLIIFLAKFFHLNLCQLNKFYHCPIKVTTFAYKFYTLHVATIMRQS